MEVVHSCETSKQICTPQRKIPKKWPLFVWVILVYSILHACISKMFYIMWLSGKEVQNLFSCWMNIHTIVLMTQLREVWWLN